MSRYLECSISWRDFTLTFSSLWLFGLWLPFLWTSNYVNSSSIFFFDDHSIVLLFIQYIGLLLAGVLVSVRGFTLRLSWLWFFWLWFFRTSNYEISFLVLFFNDHSIVMLIILHIGFLLVGVLISRGDLVLTLIFSNFDILIFFSNDHSILLWFIQ